MTIEDPAIIEAKIHNMLLNAPEYMGFSFVAEQIEAYIRMRQPDACQHLISCARAFVSLRQNPFFQERLRDFYECSCEDPDICQLTRMCFTDFSPSRAGIPSTEVQNAQTLISQPLGVQKAMARMHIRNHHEALLYTPWPPVVKILCENPSIQQRDILFMASRRPSMNDLLEPILESEWSSRPEIRFALAANPALNASHAIRCAVSLPPTKLRILAELPEIHSYIRAFATQILNIQTHPQSTAL
ncbi:MAG: hypothetical protein IJM59_14005 [Proteobacteria bacterium]|nr:hypothetical protein [Pseudomonadota bacterium]